MPVVYCDYCDKQIDLDYDVEHWDTAEYFKQRDDRKCRVEIEDIKWGNQSHWGDHINKHNKENRGRTQEDLQRDKLNFKK